MRKIGVFFKRTILVLFLANFIYLPVFAEPMLSAESAVLINADSGETIFEHNANIKKGMASTTKIMTAILAIESGRLNEMVTIPDEAIGVEGSSLYLQRGETMTLRELVIGLMLRSANDAAEAIAIILGGDVESFAKMMNEKAQVLGLSNTHFDNPHGLASDNHYTTAKELAKLSAYAVSNSTFREICATNSAKISGTEIPRIVTNHNKLLKLYSGAYGVKTGYTRATGRCLVSAATRNGVNLIAVTLNAPDDWNDHRELLDYGFSNYEIVNLAECNEIVATLPIIGGAEDSVPVYVKNKVDICLSKKRKSIVEKIELNYPKFAPVYQGDTVGTIRFFLDGKEIGSSPLCTSKFIGARPKQKSFLDKLFS